MKGEVHTTVSEEATEALGRGFSTRLKAGDRVALVGELGSGKTRFVCGVADGLGCRGHIKSPSFTIVNIYEGGRLPLFHIDLYRLSCADEMFEAGVEEYIYGRGVSVIEWADRVASLPDECNIVIRFTHKGGDVREIEIKTTGVGVK